MSNREPFCFYIFGHSRKRIFVGDEQVVRLVYLGRVENKHHELVLITIEGNVFLRSANGQRGPRTEPDVFIDKDSDKGPVVIDASG